MNVSVDRAVSLKPRARRVCTTVTRAVLIAMSLSLVGNFRCTSAEEFESQLEGLVIADEGPLQESIFPEASEHPRPEIVGAADGEPLAVSGDGAGAFSGGWDYSSEVASDRLPVRSGPAWDVAVDAIMLWQGNSQSLPLFLDAGGGTGFNAQSLQTQTGAGVRVGLLRYIADRYAIEGNYFSARPFEANGVAPASGGPYTMTNMGDLVFDDIKSAQIGTTGWIQSAEINWRRCECWCPITWLAGFRWVELNSQANIDYDFANPDPIGSGTVNTHVGNNLYGGQLGADIRLWNARGRWRVNSLGKAGIFYNSSSFQRSSAGFVYSDGKPYPLGNTSATADQTSFFGEIGLNSTYWITDWLAWRAGYTVMWAAGVAVAPEQLPLNDFGDRTASINTNGSVLLHGVTTGIEARW